MGAGSLPPAGADARAARARWATLGAAFLGWFFDGFEMGLFPIVARPALRDLLGGAVDADIGRWMGWITALFLLGAAAGGLVFGWLGDRLGRVRAMALSILCYSLFTGLGWLATEPWHLGGLRFLAALGMGGEWSLGVALVMETWPERRRPWLAAAIGAAANLGFLGVSLLTTAFPVAPGSWRWLMLVGALPALLVFFVRLFVPESERWRRTRARAASRPLRDLFAPGLRPRVLLGIALASVALIGTWGSVQWIPVWVDQMTGGALPSAKAQASQAQAAGSVVGSFLAPMIAVRIGRRRSYALLCLAALGACALLFRGGHETFDARFLSTVGLAGLTTAAFYGWFPLYLPELFPTRVRATGQGIAFNAGRVVAAAGAVLTGELVAAFDGSYARAGATITLVYVLGLVFIAFAPETRGQPLAD